MNQDLLSKIKHAALLAKNAWSEIGYNEGLTESAYNYRWKGFHQEVTPEVVIKLIDAVDAQHTLYMSTVKERNDMKAELDEYRKSSEDVIEETKKISTDLTRHERLQAFLDANKDIDFVHIHNIMDFVNGQLSVGGRNGMMKIPLSINQKELLPEPNLAHFQSPSTANMFGFLVFIDLKDAK